MEKKDLSCLTALGVLLPQRRNEMLTIFEWINPFIEGGMIIIIGAQIAEIRVFIPAHMPKEHVQAWWEATNFAREHGWSVVEKGDKDSFSFILGGKILRWWEFLKAKGTITINLGGI